MNLSKMETKDDELNERLTSGEDGKSHLIPIIGGNIDLKFNLLYKILVLVYINNSQS